MSTERPPFERYQPAKVPTTPRDMAFVFHECLKQRNGHLPDAEAEQAEWMTQAAERLGYMVTLSAAEEILKRFRRFVAKASAAQCQHLKTKAVNEPTSGITMQCTVLLRCLDCGMGSKGPEPGDWHGPLVWDVPAVDNSPAEPEKSQ